MTSQCGCPLHQQHNFYCDTFEKALPEIALIQMIFQTTYEGTFG